MSGSGGSVDFVARPLELVERVVGGGGTQQEQGQGQEQDGGGSNGVHTRVVEAFRGTCMHAFTYR